MGQHPARPRTLDKLATINDDGSRHRLHPADVKGKFSRARPVVHVTLILIYALLPWVQVGGSPAILIDIPARRFYFFGGVFNAQDFYLAFPILTGIGFSLILTSALFGRVWCGWACPQTVFLESVFRRIERWIDGPRAAQLRLEDAPWTAEKVVRRVAKHGLWIFVSVNIAHMFLSYFVSLPRLYHMVLSSPAEHWTAFLWMCAISTVLYLNFWWFREQLCIVICPYGRLQSVLQDDDTLVIGYDKRRGEPRGKAKDPNAGDCVDCKRCVAVCPTGIDIRNGLQLECIGCAACIDACDDIMVKLGRKTGLVRYDSQRGLGGQKRRFFRPRVAFYAIAGLVGLAVAIGMVIGHQPFEANVVRPKGVPFMFDGELVRNQVFIHVINKAAEPSEMTLEARSSGPVTVQIPKSQVHLDPLDGAMLPVLFSVERTVLDKGRLEVPITIHHVQSDLTRVERVRVLGPKGG